MDYKNGLRDLLHEQLKDHLDEKAILEMIEKPKHEKLGDYAFPCFQLAKVFRKPPQVIAGELAVLLHSPLFEKVESVGGYVNVFLNKTVVTKQVLSEILKTKEHYGDSGMGKGEVITMDLSSPNIAKPFSMGHLRSTVIGHSIGLLAEKCGYKPIRINHLGDWGTQFGKLITAYKKWGSEKLLEEKDPIKELLKLYVRFHDEADAHPELNEQAREWFKKLEEGDEEALSLWKWFREESLSEFNKIYELLGVIFDSNHGEAFYNDKMEAVVQELKEKQLLVESEGAQVVLLDDPDTPPCLIKKKDGTTLYATRDLAAAIYRYNTYHFTKSLYIVGNEQTLHFKQIKLVLEKLGYSWSKNLCHIPFGMILKGGKKMSTRKGKLVLLEEVLEQAIQMAMANIHEKNPTLAEKEEVARAVGIGAIIFHDLKHDRHHDVEFSMEEMLTFEGDTGPYVQYTHARAASLLNKGNYANDAETVFNGDEYSWSIVTQLMTFPETVVHAFEAYDPSLIAKYVLDLSKAFNKYYASVRILEEDGLKQERLSLIDSVKIVLKEGLRLLGMKAPEQM